MNNDLVFVSAQPDELYFHWQCKIYVHNFIEMGIPPKNIHILFSIQENNSPSEESLKLKEYGVNVHHYVDDRPSKKYIPSIRPRILGKWLYEFPNLKKLYFYHDSDIVFRKLPNFDILLNDSFIYLSDTRNYLGYNFLKMISNRYHLVHTELNENSLIDMMLNIVGINNTIVELNEPNCGGAQHLMKNIDYTFWDKVYTDSENLFENIYNFDKKYNFISGGVQSWTADMWAVLWNLWYFGYETRISEQLSFSWAADDLIEYEKHNIFHNAGIFDDTKGSIFFKGEFRKKSPFDMLKKNKNYFSYIQKNNSTTKYIEIMKSIIEKEDYMYL
jgi:hypothetical protein